MNPSSQAKTPHAALAALLFGKGETPPAYAILDGASAPGLLKKLYQHEPEYCCLYRGELPPDMAAVAPYLVRLEPETELTDWALSEGWGAHWGILMSSTADLRALRNHFREFLRVELPDRSTAFFRYYDPRILRDFLPVCNPDELKEFFGPVQNFVMESEAPDMALRFSFAGNALKSEPLSLKEQS